MTKSQLFTNAHTVARTLEGDYRARFSYALTQAWKEFKGAEKMIELKGTEKQVKWANDIRKVAIENIELLEKAVNEITLKSEDTRKKHIERIAEARKYFENVESAKELIENYKQFTDSSEYRKISSSNLYEIADNFKITKRIVNYIID